jgi:TatD DNase family protein
VSLIDSHCHLDSADFDPDRDAVIERALDAGVEHMVAIGTGNGPPDLEAGIRIADRSILRFSRPRVHPHDAAKRRPRPIWKRLERSGEAS